jgi:hypothetical protein
MEKNSNYGTWYCPLYQKDINEGLCLDINYERLEYFKSCTLKNTINMLYKSLKEISLTCDNCPNCPLNKE